MKRTDLPKFVVYILQRLKEDGFQAFVVGGAVRDAHLARSITDWDVATNASAGEVTSLFGNVRHFILKQTTVTLVHSGRNFEITPFKGKENRLEEDLGHRDFTINAMAFDADTEACIDPYGGRKDISAGVIRAVVDPAGRFQEDPLRLLRAIRFANELGFEIEETTMQTLTLHASLIQRAAPERIREEMLKILMSPKPSAGFGMMRRTGLLAYVLPELLQAAGDMNGDLPQDTVFTHLMETIDRVKADPVLKWAALLHHMHGRRPGGAIDRDQRSQGSEKTTTALAEKVMKRLKFSSKRISKVTKLIALHQIDYRPEWTDAAVRRFIRLVGPERVMDVLTLRRADLLSQKREVASLEELEDRVKREMGATVGIKDLAVNGERVMEILGISDGPEVGRILANLVERVTDEPALNEEKKLLALLLQWRDSK